MLMIHLPLNGDLHNQGLANIEVTNNGATVDNNGKIGKCYSFDGTSKYISLTNPLTDASEISCSVWVKPLTNTSTNEQIINIGTNSGWTNIRFGILQRSINQFIFHVSDGTNQINYACASGTIALNEWINIICTYKERTLKMYLNGELVKTHSISFDPSFSGISNIGIGAAPNGSEKFTGCINDVRIFTHCLSLKEISELKKLLILHYPLDNNGFGGENIVPQTGELTLWTKENNVTCIQDGEWFTITDVDERAARWGIYKNDIAIESNTDYTLQIECIGNTNVQLCTNSSIASKIQPISNFSGKKITTFNTAELFGTDATCYMRIYIWPTYSNNHVSKIKHLKIEKGLKPTPWCPNSSDESAATIGMNDGIEYDCSGFGNNGTRVGTFSWSSDTPRYFSSTIFEDDCNQYIHAPYLSFLTNNITMSCWTYQTSASNTEGTMQYIMSQGRDTNYNGFSIRSSNGIVLLSLNTGTGTNLGTSTNILNGWHHIVATYNGSIACIYIDGQLKNSANITGDIDYSMAYERFVVGKMSYGYSLTTHYFPFVGNISDVRIYATALSAEDVQQLYSVSAVIDSQGNTFASSYVEG